MKWFPGKNKESVVYVGVLGVQHFRLAAVVFFAVSGLRMKPAVGSHCAPFR